jgi:type IV pilus assembly protein PilP
MSRRLPTLVLPLAAALLPTLGCEDEAPPPPAAATPAAGGPAAPAAAAPVAAPPAETPTVYTYNAVGKRDPFRSYFAEVDEADEQNKVQSELQRFDIDQLKLIGVVVGTATPIGMVEDPQGLGHVVREGTLMGKHWGQVKHIRRGEIIIQEEFRDFTGRRVSHLVPLKIPEDDQKK